MRRAVSTLLILLIGSLVLWEVVAQGTRVWMKYGLMKEPLPSLTTLVAPTLLPNMPVLTTMLVAVATAVSIIMAFLRSKRLFGIIPLSELNRHAVVLGPTGSGKTTVAKMIANKVLTSSPKNPPTLIIVDWKGEYASLFPGATIIRKVDFWNVPGDSPRERALMATEMIREISKDVVEVTPSSSLLLLRVLEEEYKRGIPTTERIMTVLDKHAQIAMREGKYAESNMYLALIRRLYVILVHEERHQENIEGDPRIVVYDLARLPIYIKTLYSSYVLATLYRSATKAGTGEGLKTLLIAEEAQNYVRPRRHDELPSIAERLIFELRAFGVGVILVCPDPELLPAPVLKDVGAVVAMGPDSLPRFALERYLFRASLEEAEDVLKQLKKAKAILYYRGRLHFLRRLPRPPRELKLKAGPKGDRMGVTDPGGRSLRTWPILPRRSPGRPAKVVKEEQVEERPVTEVVEQKRPKVVEVKEELEERPKVKVIEVKVAEVSEEPLKLEEEELEEEPEIKVKESGPIATEPVEEKTVEEPTVEVKEEIEEKLTEEMPMTVEPETAPKGPPIPSSLPYRGSLCPAGRTATSGRVL